jgi:class 3 adenylate cyclase
MNEMSALNADDVAARDERKLLTLLFADVTGYTRMTATLDPEDVFRRIGPLLTELVQVAEQHGAHVPSVQGDGFLAVFGAPTSHADDPRRAMEAALAMRDVVQSLREAGSEAPDVHLGIATGEVLVTVRDAQHAVLGAAVNLASRLSDAAGPGEILVDEASAQLTSEEAAFGTVRTLSLAGFAGAVRALPLMGMARGLGSHGAPVVGRATELAELDRLLDSVRAGGSSTTVLVTGEAGAGKSRLIEEWRSRHPDVLLLRGNCRPYGSPLPLSALSEALTQAGPSVPDSDAGEAAYADFVRLLPRQRTAIGTGGREPDEAVALAARRMLEALSRSRAVGLVLEDVHWADKALLDVVHALHSEPIHGQLLVIASSRDSLPGVSEIRVPALSSDQVAQVVEHLLAVPADDALLRLLVERSAGNPLWLVECVALLRERGQLLVENGTAVIRDPRGGIEVPASIRLVVAARLDSLPSHQKAALQRLSTWPTAVPPGSWPADPQLVNGLVEAGLLALDRHGHIRFTHGLVREAVYNSMPRAARVAEHEALMMRTEDAAVRAYSALEIRRLDVAPDPDRRRLISERALTAVTEHARHLRTSHTGAARDVLLRASDLVGEIDITAPGASAVLLTELAEVYRDLEDGRSVEVATRAVALAELASDEEVLLQARLALGEASLGSHNQRSRELAEAVLSHPGLHPRLRGRAWQVLATSHSYDDTPRMLECLQQAFSDFVAVGEVDAAAAVARRLALNLSVTADAQFDRWFSVAGTSTPLEHLRGQAELAFVGAVVAQARGEWEQSWEQANIAMRLAERVGMHHALVDATCVAVEAATITGRRVELPGLISRMMALTEGRRPRLRITGLCATAPALALLGRESEADRTLATAKALLPSLGPNEATMFWAAQGHAAALAEKHEAARDAYSKAEELAGQLGLTLFARGCRLQRLIAQAHRGDPVDTRQELLEVANDLEGVRATALAETARAFAASLAT